MAVAWHCDLCGKSTYVNPPSEPLWENKSFEAQVPYTEDEVQRDGSSKKVLKYRTEAQTHRMPKLTMMKRQNPHTGEIENIQIQATQDLAPRAYLVRLSIGLHEYIQKDFCFDCLQTLKPDIQALWNKLDSIKGQGSENEDTVSEGVQ